MFSNAYNDLLEEQKTKTKIPEARTELKIHQIKNISPLFQHWLDPTKRVARQIRTTSPVTLYLGVKFYAADPCRLIEEITRYQFFLQVSHIVRTEQNK